MEIVIITGMSGAGKTSVMNLCQDNGYYCMDNMPPQLIRDFLDLAKFSMMEIEKMAFVIDIRGGVFFEDFTTIIEELKSDKYNVKIIYVDSDDQVLIRRYKEHRRPHPMGRNLPLEIAIENERSYLDQVRKMADYHLNTSKLTLGQLKSKIEEWLATDGEFYVQVTSFGFKHGILAEADLVFDVRFIPNPYYDLDLRELTGKDQAIKDFIFSYGQTEEFISRLEEMLNFLIPFYKKEGKNSLVVGIGCTGGRHRSPAIAEELYKRLNTNNNVVVYHRESNMW